jgi:hypothetical protein
LYSIVVVPRPWLSGIGNSPPARNSAVSPESAVRLGSDSVVTSPIVSPASRAPSTSRPNNLPTPASVAVPGFRNTLVPACWMNWPGLLGSGTCWVMPVVPTPRALPGKKVDAAARPRVMPNWKPPVPSMLARFMPSVRTSERLTSAKRTRKLTCRGVAMRKRETTLAPSPRKAAARRSASAASSGADTVPVSSTVLAPIVATWMLASGIARPSIWSMLSRFEPTRTLADQMMSPAELLA